MFLMWDALLKNALPFGQGTCMHVNKNVAQWFTNNGWAITSSKLALSCFQVLHVASSTYIYRQPLFLIWASFVMILLTVKDWEGEHSRPILSLPILKQEAHDSDPWGGGYLAYIFFYITKYFISFTGRGNSSTQEVKITLNYSYNLQIMPRNKIYSLSHKLSTLKWASTRISLQRCWNAYIFLLDIFKKTWTGMHRYTSLSET